MNGPIGRRVKTAPPVVPLARPFEWTAADEEYAKEVRRASERVTWSNLRNLVAWFKARLGVD
jgi:hypothetical protein